MTESGAAPALPPAVAETHISTVFFAGDRAYKLLKPIRTSFLDFSTTERRLKAVDDELELNRRMAPSVYLGSADVIENGSVVDRLLVMRRLPADRRLTELIERAGADAIQDCVRSIARTVAVFHAAQEPLLDAHAIAGVEALARNWRDNHDDMAPLVGPVLSPVEVDRVRTLVARFLDHRSALFDRRIAEGFVRDGHGDLTAQDIFCLPDGPQILDCLAFDPALRISDVLLDVAFLAMDLDRLAGSKTSAAFLRWYREFSNEHHPAALAHHYVAYRAHVRAKVAGIRYRQGDLGAAAEVRAYHSLCLQHLERGSLSVFLVGGTPGTGKSTLSRGLSDAFGAMVLGTDELRKDLAGRGHLDHEVAGTDEGIYRPELSDRTYEVLLEHAGAVLDRAESVVLDASWNRADHRHAARSLAAAKGADVFEIHCVLDAETAKDRVRRRLAAGNDPSDARPELLDELRARHEPWPTAMAVDTGQAPDAVVRQVIAALEHRS